MSLVERVSKDLVEAMKAKESERASALRMIRAAFIEAQKEGKGEVTDEWATDLLKKLKKQRLESAEQYDAAKRSDLADKERAEAAIIDVYLPQMADEATTTAWVKAAIAATGVTNPREMGKVMGLLMKEHKAVLDAGLARKVIEAELKALGG